MHKGMVKKRLGKKEEDKEERGVCARKKRGKKEQRGRSGRGGVGVESREGGGGKYGVNRGGGRFRESEIVEVRSEASRR